MRERVQSTRHSLPPIPYSLKGPSRKACMELYVHAHNSNAGRAHVRRAHSSMQQTGVRLSGAAAATAVVCSEIACCMSRAFRHTFCAAQYKSTFCCCKHALTYKRAWAGAAFKRSALPLAGMDVLHYIVYTTRYRSIFNKCCAAKRRHGPGGIGAPPAPGMMLRMKKICKCKRREGGRIQGRKATSSVSVWRIYSPRIFQRGGTK